MNYYITAVEYNSDGTNISYVSLHRINSERRVERGVRTSRANVIQLINQGHNVRTAMWNYTSSVWSGGATVIVYNYGFSSYIKTVSDSTTRDNLGNLLPGSHIA